MFNSLKKIFGLGADAQLKPLQQKADEIERLEPQFAALTDDELSHKTIEFKERYQQG